MSWVLSTPIHLHFLFTDNFDDSSVPQLAYLYVMLPGGMYRFEVYSYFLNGILFWRQIVKLQSLSYGSSGITHSHRLMNSTDVQQTHHNVSMYQVSLFYVRLLRQRTLPAFLITSFELRYIVNCNHYGVGLIDNCVLLTTMKWQDSTILFALSFVVV